MKTRAPGDPVHPRRAQWSRPLRPVAGLLAAALLTACGTAVVAPQPETPAPTRSEWPQAPASDETSTTRPAPVDVRIDSIDVAEELIRVGLTSSGRLEVPADPSRVGWFDGGGRPGGPGPTVLVGHVDSTTGPAVFSRLTELSPGDRVEVSTGRDTRTTYEVRRTRDFDQDDFPTADVFGATTGDELRLITCTGDFDEDRGGYQQNRVVFAVAAG